MTLEEQLEELSEIQKCLRTRAGRILMRYLVRHYCKPLVDPNSNILAARAGCRQLVDDLSNEVLQSKIDRILIAMKLPKSERHELEEQY